MAEVKRRKREYWAGLGAVAIAVAVATFRWWPVPPKTEGSVVEAVALDPVIVGILRMTILLAALYAIASVPALVVGGRWAKGVGSAGFVADDVHAQVPAFVAEIQRELAGLRLDNRRLIADRDELLSLIDAETKPQ